MFVHKFEGEKPFGQVCEKCDADKVITQVKPELMKNRALVADCLTCCLDTNGQPEGSLRYRFKGDSIFFNTPPIWLGPACPGNREISERQGTEED
ncbi:MAG: hypothetical protein WCT01_04825 [Candidatus Shapirobacteria bacterium]|jgi:hypothetical protein